MDNEKIITLFNVEKVLESLEIIKTKCLKKTIEEFIDFESISELILSYHDIKNAIEGLDRLQQFIMKNKNSS